MSYKVEILDKNRNPITVVREFVEIDKQHNYLDYTKRLSQWGTAKFRVGTKDPALTSLGITFMPFMYHIRISRFDVVVFQGILYNVPHRNKLWIEIEAVSYMWLLDHRRIKHDAETVAGDGKDNYRTLSTGTMQSYLTSFITETATYNPASILAGMTVGTIENPSFPAGYTKASGAPLTGAWTFSSDMILQFSYVSVYYVISQLALYGISDFELTTGLVFNFKKFLGNKQTNLMFEYGQYGNIEDFDVPYIGKSMANDIIGVAATPDGKIIHTQKTDNASTGIYELLQATAAYKDIKDKNALNTRIGESLRYSNTPEGDISILLNDSAYPLGTWDVGDQVTIKVGLGAISYLKEKRIVGYDIKVNLNGKESIYLHTNDPRPEQG